MSACLLGLGVLTAFAQPSKPIPRVKPDVLAAPALARGTNGDYQHAVLLVEQAMESGAFDKAAELVKLLPQRQPKIIWDDSKVPAELRTAVQRERDRALRDWASTMGLSPTFVQPGARADMKISFEPVLGKSADSIRPLSVAGFFSTDPKALRFDYVIGLQRGAPLALSTIADIGNDLRYGIGLYLGLADSPFPSGCMYRDDKRTSPVGVGGLERVTAQHNFALVDGLLNCIGLKQKVAGGLAIAFVDPLKLEAPSPGSDKPVLQGTTIHFAIQVTNRGAAPMETQLIPGCSCFSTIETQTIPAGGTVLFPLDMNTDLYQAPLTKTVFLVTGDADRPVIGIPVHVNIKARYRFLLPEGNTILVGPSGGELTAYLAVEGEPLHLAGQPSVTGVPGSVTYEPWSGSLPDPALNEASRPRNGYKLNIDVRPPFAPGITYISLNVPTTDSTFRTLTVQLLAQRGIVAFPESAYFGHIPPRRREMEIAVTRPRKPFHVTGLLVDDSKHLHVTQHVAEGKPWEHVLKIVFDGQVPPGQYSSTIRVQTDDPEQKVIVIPVSAMVD
ncbi:MAG TPA: hypothetical protein VKT78_17875 [Fimbriimonadaceae bacterium]|nr:hypothetical protein [Fimbriimonadaceae bacterium]